jgi:phage terminase large subunit
MPYTRIFGDCNPDQPQHWIKRRESSGRLQLLESRHEDNPTLYTDAGELTDQGHRTMRVLDGLTGVRRLRLRDGKWVKAEGVVYETYDAAVHLKDADELPAFAHYVAGVDWGFTNPGVIQVWGVDNDGRMYLVREVVRTKQTIDYWIEQAKALNETYRPEAFACDPAEPSYITQFAAHVPAVAGFNEIEAGINAVQQRFKPADDGKPRLYLSRAALAEQDENLIAAKLPDGLSEELDAYSWPKGQDGKPVKETPVDKDNHSCDAMRYAVAHVDDLASERAELDSGGFVLTAGGN